MKRELTDKQKKNHARFKAMPVAWIKSPLKFIADRVNTYAIDESGQKVPVLGWHYKAARLAADEGAGRAVQLIARQVHRLAGA